MHNSFIPMMKCHAIRVNYNGFMIVTVLLVVYVNVFWLFGPPFYLFIFLGDSRMF